VIPATQRLGCAMLSGASAANSPRPLDHMVASDGKVIAELTGRSLKVRSGADARNRAQVRKGVATNAHA
jgi:hypothetical protein